jgi:cytochrome c oxidase assembly protein subunit 15
MSSTVIPDTPGPSPWLHRWAVLTACATVVLLFLGANVTTLGVGMADTEWPTHPLHLFFASRAQLQAMGGLGYIIEHSHRLAGYVVGCCVIVLCVWLWLAERRRWLCWLGTAALLGVSIQGILGGLRVLKNARLGVELATIHGIFAQLVFALLVSIALFTSRRWRVAPEARSVSEGGSLANASGFQRWAVAFSVLVFAQIILGALVRHSHSRLAQRGHILVAFAGAVVAVWLILAAWERGLRITAGLLGVLLTAQIVLGVEAWMLRFGSRVLPELQRVTIGSGMVRTLHFVLGSLVFASSVVLALLARRPSAGVAPLRAAGPQGEAA